MIKHKKPTSTSSPTPVFRFFYFPKLIFFLFSIKEPKRTKARPTAMFRVNASPNTRTDRREPKIGINSL